MEKLESRIRYLKNTAENSIQDALEELLKANGLNLLGVEKSTTETESKIHEVNFADMLTILEYLPGKYMKEPMLSNEIGPKLFTFLNNLVIEALTYTIRFHFKECKNLTTKRKEYILEMRLFKKYKITEKHNDLKETCYSLLPKELADKIMRDDTEHWKQTKAYPMLKNFFLWYRFYNDDSTEIGDEVQYWFTTKDFEIDARCKFVSKYILRKTKMYKDNDGKRPKVQLISDVRELIFNIAFRNPRMFDDGYLDDIYVYLMNYKVSDTIKEEILDDILFLANQNKEVSDKIYEMCKEYTKDGTFSRIATYCYDIIDIYKFGELVSE